MTSNKTQHNYNLRAITATLLLHVIENGQSLSQLLPEQQNHVNHRDKALLHELSYGILRHLSVLEFYLAQLMQKPFKGKQRILHYLLLTGIYQLSYTRIAAHAAVAETVNAATILKKQSLKGVINGVLRQFIRQQSPLTHQIHDKKNNDLRYCHPDWLLQRIKRAYPSQWQAILEANNQKPPIWLRINRLHHSASSYQQLLTTQNIVSYLETNDPYALRLEHYLPVEQLPGFEQGWVTIQDIAAQQASYWLAPQPYERILDLCAAPGGKTTHILELSPTADVWAIDIDNARLVRVAENLQRLQQRAKIIHGNALYPQAWCHNLFDRILVDAPCSGTGVIRRHPDIKWLRQETDVKQLVKQQEQILTAIWSYLKPGGTLVYTTCSILPDENNLQVTQFLANHKNATLLASTHQVLPSPHGGDGFFYAKLGKLL